MKNRIRTFPKESPNGRFYKNLFRRALLKACSAPHAKSTRANRRAKASFAETASVKRAAKLKA